ncbi:hypothetical protein V6N13_022831 [Hibiscus sabdariffa]
MDHHSTGCSVRGHEAHQDDPPAHLKEQNDPPNPFLKAQKFQNSVRADKRPRVDHHLSTPSKKGRYFGPRNTVIQ